MPVPNVAAEIVSPEPGSKVDFSRTETTFEWEGGISVDTYTIAVGSTSVSVEYSATTTDETITIPAMPGLTENMQSVRVTLFSTFTDGTTQKKIYFYSNDLPIYEGPEWFVDADTEEGGNGSEDAPFKTIQEAVDAASEGHTVHVLSGEHMVESTIVINKTLTITGDPAKTSIVKGVGLSSGKMFDVVEAGGTIFENLVLEEAGLAILINRSEGSIVRNNVFRDNFEAVAVNLSNNVILEGNFIENNSYGAVLSEVTGATFKNNILKNNNAAAEQDARPGLILFGVHESEISGNTITEHYVAMRIEESTLNMIKDNVLRDNVRTIDMSYEVNNNTFDGNTIENNQHGPVFMNMTGLKFMNNILKNNNSNVTEEQPDLPPALWLSGVHESEISGNTITEHYVAMRIEESTLNMIKGNVLRDNVRTIDMSYEVNNNTFDGNTIENNQHGPVFMNMTGLKFMNNILKNNNSNVTEEQPDLPPALWLSGVHESEISGNTITEHYVAMRIEESTLNMIKGNVLRDNVRTIDMSYEVNNNTFDGNTIENNQHGPVFMNMTGLKFMNNILKNNNSNVTEEQPDLPPALWLSGVHESEISGNTITEHYVAMRIEESTLNMIKGNVLRDNVRTIDMSYEVNNNTFDGNTIENNQHGPVFMNMTGLKFMNNILKNNNSNVTEEQPDLPPALWLSGVHESEISGNTITEHYVAMRIEESTLNMIKGNVLRDNVRTIDMSYEVNNNTFDGNTIENNQHGPVFMNMTGLKFMNNILKNNNSNVTEEQPDLPPALWLSGVHESEISGNTITEHYVAMRIEESTLNMIKDNVLRDNVRTIDMSYEVNNNTFDGNTIENNQHGPVFMNMTGLKFMNNIMKNNTQGALNDAFDLAPGLWLNGVHESEISGNTFEENHVAMRIEESTLNMFKANQIRNNFSMMSIHYEVDNNTFDGNTIENNQQSVAFAEMVGLKFINNTLKNNGHAGPEGLRPGLWLNGVHESEVNGNTFDEHDIGARLEGSTLNEVAFNTFTNNQVCMELDEESQNNNIHDNNGCDVGQIPPYEGPDWYVDADAAEDGNGSSDYPFKTIQESVDVASEGHTIHVLSGTHMVEGTVNIDKTLTIIGDPAKTSIIQGTGFDGGKMFNVVNASNFVFENLVIENAGSALAITNSPGSVVKNNTFRQNFETIFIDGNSDDSSFEGNLIEDNNYGAVLTNSVRLRFVNNILKNNNAATQEDSRAALYMQQVYDSEIAGNVIEGQYEAMRVRDSEGEYV